MKNKEIANALVALRPGAKWVVHGDGMAGIEWLDDTQSCPTEDEIVAAIAAYVPPPTQEDRIAQLEAIVAKLMATK